MRVNTARAADRGCSVGRSSRRVSHARALSFRILTAFAVAVSGVAATSGETVAAEATAGLDVVGYLPDVPGAPKAGGLHGTFFMDAPNRRLYTVYSDVSEGGTHLVEFDLDAKPVPRFTRDVALGQVLRGWQRPNQVALDSKRRRGYVLAHEDAGPVVGLLDLEDMKLAGEWSLAEKGAPGVVPLGITYSKNDRRLYVVGHATGDLALESLGRSRPYTPVVVLALDPDSGEVLWRNVVPKCGYAMYTAGNGSLIVRSDNRKALYFACVKTDESPGQSGIVRIWIEPKATQQEADAFPTEFFPISGQYTSGKGVTGFAGFDYKAERFYMLSQSAETPGAWVFDGDLSSWVGFIAATDQLNTGLGIDQSNGHVYIKSGGDGQLILADGRATPVPQGIRLDFKPIDGFYLVDPKTHRAFVWTAIKDPTYGARGEIAVLKDTTPRSDSLRPPDYDALTRDIPEGPQTITSFSGGVNGYATRLLMVGGLPVTPGDTRPGDRGVTAARVPSLDLREVAAQGAAQAVVTDTNTEAELQEEAGAEWPWSPANCLDGIGSKVVQTKEEQGGFSTVECDLANERATATSFHSAISGEYIGIGSSYFTSTVARSPDSGVTTNTQAQTSGVSISTPQGKLSIGEVVVRARTSAHGRPGTTRARWERHLRGVSVVDAEGTEILPQGSCSSTSKEDTCGPLVKQINDSLPRVRIDLYQPEIVKTPKGAYAGIQQSNAQYYQGRTVYNQGTAFALENASRATPALQIVAFNDGAEKSRAIVQLGAVQAGSIYTISKPPPPTSPEDPAVFVPKPSIDQPADPGSASLGPAGATTTSTPISGGASLTDGLGSTPADQGSASAPTDMALPTSPAAAVESVLAFVTRSPKEALLFGVFWVLLAAAVWTVMRRRSLVSLLSGEVS